MCQYLFLVYIHLFSQIVCFSIHLNNFLHLFPCMKILVIAGFGFGDIITTTPLLRTLKKIPSAQVFLFNEKAPSKNRAGKHLLSDCPYIDGYVTLERITEPHFFKRFTNFSSLL